jgi:hypothetical protein
VNAFSQWSSGRRTCHPGGPADSAVIFDITPIVTGGSHAVSRSAFGWRGSMGAPAIGSATTPPLKPCGRCSRSDHHDRSRSHRFDPAGVRPTGGGCAVDCQQRRTAPGGRECGGAVGPFTRASMRAAPRRPRAAAMATRRTNLLALDRRPCGWRRALPGSRIMKTTGLVGAAGATGVASARPGRVFMSGSRIRCGVGVRVRPLLRHRCGVAAFSSPCAAIHSATVGFCSVFSRAFFSRACRAAVMVSSIFFLLMVSTSWCRPGYVLGTTQGVRCCGKESTQ